MGWYLGVEIGGTKLQLAIGTGAGEPFRAFNRHQVDPREGALGIQTRLLAGSQALLAAAGLHRRQIAGAAIGFGGPVDTAAGLVVTSHQVGGWNEYPLVRWFEKNFGWQALLHNDADTAALAEARFGAGRGFDPLLYVTVGSGIGGGLIVQGSVYRGGGAGALEIGHLRPGQLPLRVGQPGATVESIASGFGMEERARRVLADREEATVLVETRFQSGANPVPAQREPRRYPERFAGLMSLAGGDRQRITARLIAQAAARGDALSRDLLADATTTLGWALAQAITLVNPARIVVGGGVSLAGHELFFEPLRRACQAEVFRPFAGLSEIVPAALGEEVVVHGALALARDAFAGAQPIKAFEPAE